MNAVAGNIANAQPRKFFSNTMVAVLIAVALMLVAWELAHMASGDVAGRPAWDSGSTLYAGFGAIAVLAFWLVSAALINDWNPFALAMGQDKTLSTSKMQALLWTATVAFVYVTIYADRSIAMSTSQPFDTIPRNVLIALGLSLTTVVAARAITGSQTAANPDSKPLEDEKSYDPAALIRNDGSDVASLTKVQMLFWTVVAMAVYVVTTFKGLDYFAHCATTEPNCGLPDIDTSLMIFMGLGHATYLGGKLASTSQPLLATASAVNAGGAQTIVLSGSNLGTSGTIMMNGTATTVANLNWSPTAITFALPPKADGSAWSTGDTAIFSVSVQDANSASVVLTLA